MAMKTWTGSDGAFATDGNWTLREAPATGDWAIITAGTVTANGMLPSSLTIEAYSSNSSSPTLILSGATLPASSLLSINAAGTNATVRLNGSVNNAGVITVTGANPGAALFQLDDAPGGGVTRFVNTGSIQVSDTNLQVVTAGSNAADGIQNNGTISIRSPSRTPLLAYVSADLTGSGIVTLGSYVTFEAVRAVGAGQVFVFEPGGGATLRIDDGMLFAAALTGFVSSDTIQLNSGRWDTAAYASDNANSGVLTLSLGGRATTSIKFNGTYTVESFRLQEAVPPGSSQASTTITVDDPLFNAAYYLSHNVDVAAAGVDPYQHFMANGWREGRNPGGLFDVSYYRAQNPDVAAAGINMLTHFEQYGWREGREPSLLFSSAKYLGANQDVRTAGVDPLLHYLQYGQDQGRAIFLTGGMAAADTLVDPAFYDRQLGATIIPSGIEGQQQAAWSYDATGWKIGLNPNAFFDTSYYLTQNPDVKASGMNPVTHFELYGWREGRDPSLLFSIAEYSAAYQDVKGAGLNPLLHFVQYGQSEGRTAFLPGEAAAADPLVDGDYYNRQLGATLIPAGTTAQQQAASGYDAFGWQKGLNPDAFFDTNFYLSHNPDVAAAHYNPVKHYEQYGWHEGRDPSAQFSTSRYLGIYADVRAAGLNPLEAFSCAMVRPRDALPFQDKEVHPTAARLGASTLQATPASGALQRFEQQSGDRCRLLLLHPVSGTVPASGIPAYACTPRPASVRGRQEPDRRPSRSPRR